MFYDNRESKSRLHKFINTSEWYSNYVESILEEWRSKWFKKIDYQKSDSFYQSSDNSEDLTFWKIIQIDSDCGNKGLCFGVTERTILFLYRIIRNRNPEHNILCSSLERYNSANLTAVTPGNRHLSPIYSLIDTVVAIRLT